MKKVILAAAAKGGKPPPPALPGALDTFKYKHTPEDAEVLAASLIPGSVMEGLGDTNWKTRLAACEEMTVWLGGVVQDVDAEVVVRAIAKKGWNEKNFQVYPAFALDLIICSTNCPGFDQAVCHLEHACRSLSILWKVVCSTVKWSFE